MGTVTIRELRNQGGEVIDRVAAGEQLTVTRDGRPVARLQPVRRSGLRSDTLLRRWRRLRAVEPETFRRDLDRVLDTRL
jgi:prevent-host-death family protein